MGGEGVVTLGELMLQAVGRLAGVRALGLEGAGVEGRLLGWGVDADGIRLVEGLLLGGHLRDHVVGEDQRQDGRDHGGRVVGGGVDGGHAGRGLVVGGSVDGGHAGRDPGALAGVGVARQQRVCVGAQAAVGAGVDLHGVAGHHSRVRHGEGGLGGLGGRPGGLVQALVEEGGAPWLLPPVVGHGAVRRLNLLHTLGLGLFVASAPTGGGLFPGLLVGSASGYS